MLPLEETLEDFSVCLFMSTMAEIWKKKGRLTFVFTVFHVKFLKKRQLSPPGMSLSHFACSLKICTELRPRARFTTPGKLLLELGVGTSKSLELNIQKYGPSNTTLFTRRMRISETRGKNSRYAGMLQPPAKFESLSA